MPVGSTACSRCGSFERYASRACVACTKERVSARYNAKRELIKAAARARYRADPEPAKARSLAYIKANESSVKARKRSSYQRSKQPYLERAKRWAAANKDRVKANHKAWRIANPDTVRHHAMLSRAERMQRMPCWLTPEHKRQIAAVYRKRRELSLSTGIPHDVDHVVPLRGKRVSGLHVPWNLQVIPRAANRKKSNRLADDDP